MLYRWTILTLLVCLSVTNASDSAKDLVLDIFHSCINQFSISCIKPKAFQWINEVAHDDTIKLTNDLSIIKTDQTDQTRELDNNLFDKVDKFLSSHALKIEKPRLLQDKALISYIPKSYLNGGLADGLIVPLSEGKSVEGRGFVKKVMIPFLLGLKFKSTVLVPLSLALIALKSWKAMTLGLLSLVLAGAMVIFKFAKPKIVNYEIVHFPHHPHHIPHHDHHPIIHDAPHWARKFSSNDIAYQAHQK